ncbi:hypothetical protein BS47DRAFT_981398 [Hydnum rufescens UP504]|uniref:Uncharacterized protein n=1 Tax=Hydnum rufescens UP504 TaxID=1448309 RepID=A0A9P6DSH9_9AGAM|nr:hypothetical protein BS47DRAFT_981398 [Hydnum rufescens UP504]
MLRLRMMYWGSCLMPRASGASAQTDGRVTLLETGPSGEGCFFILFYFYFGLDCAAYPRDLRAFPSPCAFYKFPAIPSNSSSWPLPARTREYTIFSRPECILLILTRTLTIALVHSFPP